MSNVGARIQGIVLDISPDSLKDFNDQISSFKDNELNKSKSFRIHLTLAMFSFPDDQECIDKIIPVLDNFSDNMQSIEVAVGDPTPLGDDYVVLEVISDQLLNTHYKLVEDLKPYTKEHYNPKYLNHNLSDIQKIYLHEYGYHRIREFYHPHITLGWYSDQKTRDDQLAVAPKVLGKFKFNKIYLDTCIEGSGIRSSILWERELI